MTLAQIGHEPNSGYGLGRGLPPCRAPSVSGFTFLELIVVMVLLALMASIAIPAVGSGYEARLDIFEIQVRDAFANARALAHAERAPHALVFDLATERLAIIRADGQFAQHPLTKANYLVDFLLPDQPKGLDLYAAAFGKNGVAAIYDAQGRPAASGTVELRCKNAVRMLQLDGVTGRITVP
ncbi:MAG: pilus assembly FimT family protein [Planctomycetota bacterium]